MVTSTQRWVVLVGTFLMGLVGGISYAWGVFVYPMMKAFGWSRAEAVLPYTVFMIVFTLTMFPAGRMQDVRGPRKTAMLGSLLFVVAYSLASLVGRFQTPVWLALTYGLIGGVGCGLVYASTTPPARKWFPDRPALAISIAVMGFGIAAMLFAPLKARHLIPSLGIPTTFLALGFITGGLGLLASLLVKNPPESFHVSARKGSSNTGDDIGPRKAVRTATFWMTWLTFALVAAGGFIVIGLVPVYGEQVLNLSPSRAALAISIFSFFNGFGRPLSGMLNDRYGPLMVMDVTYLLQAATLLAFPFLVTSDISLYLASAIIGWSFAVTLASFPTLTALAFGVKNMGANYGLVFTAFGLASLSPTLASWIMGGSLDYSPAFIGAGILSGAGALVVMAMKRAGILHKR
ncbi:L-lactate MFS transporter [Thermococcus thermotolerans]|uniref:L-lactate MFS transporter n=1 Tax=Thermococcus thermotolerans TaxID=2969672 RepID=UPI0021585EBB|nr:OFA family MFS transporter [Thermococcus thermotolerans]